MRVDLTKCWNPKNLFKKTEKVVSRPADREQVIDWYRTTQRPKKIGFNAEGNVQEWFHGLFVFFFAYSKFGIRFSKNCFYERKANFQS